MVTDLRQPGGFLVIAIVIAPVIVLAMGGGHVTGKPGTAIGQLTGGHVVEVAPPRSVQHRTVPDAEGGDRLGADTFQPGVLAQGNRVQIAAAVVLQIVAKQDDILAVAGLAELEEDAGMRGQAERKARSVSRNWVRCSYGLCAGQGETEIAAIQPMLAQQASITCATVMFWNRRVVRLSCSRARRGPMSKVYKVSSRLLRPRCA
jgi:hypothetical protein